MNDEFIMNICRPIYYLPLYVTSVCGIWKILHFSEPIMKSAERKAVVDPDPGSSSTFLPLLVNSFGNAFFGKNSQNFSSLIIQLCVPSVVYFISNSSARE
jgi:hypothetical protein